MKKLNILYLSKNMAGYKPASYQFEIMQELSLQSNVYFYGPGFEGYNLNDKIEDVIKKSPYKLDCLILGHSWLNDKDGSEVDTHSAINLSKLSIPKIVILNKEYTNLESKLLYIKKNKFDLGLSHHHDVEKYSSLTGTTFYFWPFAFDSQRFSNLPKNKDIDVGFSGVLQNLNKDADQSDIRAGIMNLFFHTLFDVPLIKKNKYKNINIFWNSIPRSFIGVLLSKFVRRHKFLESEEYVETLGRTKLYINTLSPKGLISPRFFESMASGSIVLCEESELYKNIFPKDVLVTFKNDLSDFEDVVNMLLYNKVKQQKIIDNAFSLVHKKHTWANRISFLIKLINKL